MSGSFGAECACMRLRGAPSAAYAMQVLQDLCQIASEVSSAGQLESSGAVGAVLRALQTWRELRVALRGLTTLRALSVAPPLRAQIVRENGVAVALALMREYPDSHLVQDIACMVLANLAVGCPHRKRKVAREGALECIVNAMRAFPDHVELQTRAALALRNISQKAQVNQYIAGKAGAVEAVADALIRFKGEKRDKELALQCVLALESMCSEDKGNRSRLVKRDQQQYDSSWGRLDSSLSASADHLSLDLSSLTSFPADIAPLQCSPVPSASELQSSLPCSRPTSPFESDLPQSGPRDPSPHQFASETPESSPEECTQHHKHSICVLRAVLHAMRRDPQNELLLKGGLQVLSHAARSSDTSNPHTRIGQWGGVTLALACIRRHQQSPHIVSRSCALLRFLALCPQNRRKMRLGITVLVRALEAHSLDAHTAREIVAALTNAVFGESENRQDAVVKGAIDAVTSAVIRLEKEHVPLLETALSALRNLVDGSQSAAEIACKENAIEAALRALDMTKEGKSDGEQLVQQRGVLLLAELSRMVPSSVAEMRKREAADWIENALSRLEKETYEELHLYGDQLLSALNGDASSCNDKKDDESASRNLIRKATTPFRRKRKCSRESTVSEDGTEFFNKSSLKTVTRWRPLGCV